MSTDKWVIIIGHGYGAFLFDGDEKEAEEMRVHKTRWECAPGKKRPATVEDDPVPSNCWNHPGFNNRAIYNDCDCPDEDCVANAHERMDPNP